MGGGIITTRVVLEQIYPVGVSNYCFRGQCSGLVSNCKSHVITVNKDFDKAQRRSSL